MLRIEALLAASALALTGLAAVALYLHSELTELRSSLQPAPSNFAPAALRHHPEGEQRRLAKLGLRDYNALTGPWSGCVRVPLDYVDAVLPLNTTACSGYVCPPCFGFTATSMPGLHSRQMATFTGCSEMLVGMGKKQLGYGTFTSALQQLEFINFNTESSVAISDGTSDFLIPPGANVWGSCMADGTNEMHLDASLRTHFRPGSEFEVVTNSSPWEARSHHGVVVRSDGVVLLMGGNTANLIEGVAKSDVWSSADGGATWVRLAYAAWGARWGHSVVLRPDGAVLVLGGQESLSFFNDVLCSVDGGNTWRTLTSFASWAGRSSFGAVVRSDGSVLVMGGSGFLNIFNDVHKSTDGGATWQRLTSGASWSGRTNFGAVVLSDDTVLVMGGETVTGVVDDVYSSTDGMDWVLMTSSPGWSPRSDFALVQRVDGGLLVLGGKSSGDVLDDAWSTTDGGYTWIMLSRGAGWSARQGHRAVVLADGTLLLLGGRVPEGLLDNTFNDVYRSFY